MSTCQYSQIEEKECPFSHGTPPKFIHLNLRLNYERVLAEAAKARRLFILQRSPQKL